MEQLTATMPKNGGELSFSVNNGASEFSDIMSLITSLEQTPGFNSNTNHNGKLYLESVLKSEEGNCQISLFAPISGGFWAEHERADLQHTYGRAKNGVLVPLYIAQAQDVYVTPITQPIVIANMYSDISLLQHIPLGIRSSELIALNKELQAKRDAIDDIFDVLYRKGS